MKSGESSGQHRAKGSVLVEILLVPAIVGLTLMVLVPKAIHALESAEQGAQTSQVYGLIVQE